MVADCCGFGGGDLGVSQRISAAHKTDKKLRNWERRRVKEATRNIVVMTRTEYCNGIFLNLEAAEDEMRLRRKD